MPFHMAQSVAAATPSVSRLQRIAEAFAERNLRLLLTANLCNDLAMWAYNIALGWLVFDLTGSPFQLGVAFSIRGAAFILGGLSGGAFADRFDRRAVVEFIQAIMVVMVATLGFVALFGTLETWHLYLATIAVAGCHGVGNPTRQSMFRDVVEPGKLASAVSINAIGMNLTRLIGPAGAGAFLKTLGAEGVFFFSAGTWIITIFAITRITKPRQSSQEKKEPFFQSLANGIAYARRYQAIAAILLLTIVFNLIAMSFQQLMSAYAKKELELGAAGFGAIMSVMGAGAVAGATFASVKGAKLANGNVFIAAVTLVGLALIGTGVTQHLGAVVPLLVVIGFTSGVAMSVSMVLVQTKVEDAYRGRVMGLYMLTFGLQYVAALPIGSIAEGIDTPATFVLMGAITAVATCIVAIWAPAIRRVASRASTRPAS